MCAFHFQAQTVPGKADWRFMGLDLVNGKVRGLVCLLCCAMPCVPGRRLRLMIQILILHFRTGNIQQRRSV